MHGDLDLGISTARTVSGPLGALTQGQPCTFLSFDHSGALPARATIYLRVGDDYSNGQALTLYLWDRDHGVLKRLDRGLKVDDAYVSFKLSHCSVYALSPVGNLCCLTMSSAKSGGGLSGAMIALIVVAFAALAAGVAWWAFAARRGRSAAGPARVAAAAAATGSDPAAGSDAGATATAPKADEPA